jgi:hypothetical protein
MRYAMVTVSVTLALWTASGLAQTIPPELTTPDRLDTRLGALEFKDGAPSAATVDKIYDNLDFTHAQRLPRLLSGRLDLCGARRDVEHRRGAGHGP